MLATALLALNLISLRQVPAGTQLHVRLSTPVGSFGSRAGDAVQALLIAPVVVSGETLLPEGATLSGKVTRAQAVGFGIAHETAGLAFDFNTVTFPAGFTTPISTRLIEVDNGRERVVENGFIRGVRTTSSIAYRTSGYIRMALAWEFHAQLALWAAKMILVQVPEPEIYYPAGVELTLALRDDLVSAAQPDPEASLSETDREDLNRITAGMPYRTYAPGSNRASDLMNLLLVGDEKEIESAFIAAGWTKPAPTTLRSRIQGIRAVAERKSDEHFPMSRLLADDRTADMSWQKGLNDVSKRHHIRIWKQDATWNGRQLWIAAATRDVDFSYLRHGSALTHRISQDLDEERDKIAHDLEFTGCTDLLDWWDRPGAPTTARNATGDMMETDGRLAVVRINNCDSPRVVNGKESEPLVSRPGFAKRLLRREILSVRSDFYRRNVYWRSYEGVRWVVLAMRHRHELQFPAPGEKIEQNTAASSIMARVRNSSWFR
jgi:hypothetical protein